MSRSAPARWGRMTFLLAVVAALPWSAARADDSPLVKLLKSGRVPEERQGTIVEMIGKRGGAADLDYLFNRAADPEGFSKPIRLKALNALAEAELTRQQRPAAGLEALARLIEPKGDKVDPAVRLAAIRLAGLWKVGALAGALGEIASAPKTGPTVRAAALDALASIGGPAAKRTIGGLVGNDQPADVRVQAVAALTRVDPDAAIDAAAPVLNAAAESGADPGKMVAALLSRQDGADKLAQAVADDKLTADAAKLAVRTMYSLGRTDASLMAELTKTAGLTAEVQPLDQSTLNALVAEVAAKGDPARGESVFRRADLNCTQCHALAGAGGGVGPELSAVGSSSPSDYIINSIMTPDQAIKEEYQTLVVLTEDGRIYQGIVVDKDDNRIILKEATGELRTIPVAEIEDRKEGGSLMPKGLVNLMTHAEFVDLVRFLAELGKPGPYAIRTTPTIQKWRVLKSVSDLLAEPVVESITFRNEITEAEPDAWTPVFGKAAGALPLEELTAKTGGKILYLQGDLDVSAAGSVTFRLDSPEGLLAWVDGKPIEPVRPEFTTALEPGRHTLTLRVDTEARKSPELRVEVAKGEASPAEFAVVGGR